MATKIMQECSLVVVNTAKTTSRMSEELCKYEEFGGFRESICEREEVSEANLFEGCSNIVKMSVQCLIDFQKRLNKFDDRQRGIEQKIHLAKAKFDEISGLTKINDLKGFIGSEVTNQDLSSDILS